MGNTGRLAEFALDPALDHPPAAVAERVGHCLLDAIGCAIGGAFTTLGRRMREVVAEQGGAPVSTVIAGGGLKLPPMSAALCNGQQANVLDFDDTYLDLGHTGTAVIPAALAVGEQVGATAEQLRGAIVAGYEVANRIGLATRPSDNRFRLLYPVGWHSFGATVAAGRLLGLSHDQMQNAIGIAAEHAQVATTVTTDRVHAFKAGKLGQSSAIGVFAAQLAARGFEGKQTILEDDRFLWMTLGSDRFEPCRLIEDLGDRYTINDVSFKPYPSCRMTHPALGAAEQIVRGHGVAAGQIDRITIRAFTRMLQLADAAPHSVEAIPFALPFVTALVLLRLPAGPAWADDAVLTDTAVLDLAARVDVVAEPAIDAIVDQTARLPAEVEVRLMDGRVFHARCDDAPWGPDDPPSGKALLAKFLGMATPVLGEHAAVLADGLLSTNEDALDARTIAMMIAGPRCDR
jgi:2-methylcitrate dehydratase PrpD